jgi:Apea-like HEPN
VADDNWRDWLSVPELEQLRNLLPLYNRNAPEKVRLARKHIDNAFYAYFLDERFASLVTSFESLLKTSRNDLTEQFKVRAARLAEMLGLELSREDLHNSYAHRSDFVHGSRPNFEGLSPETDGQAATPPEFNPELIGRYNRCEHVLRLALLRASTEPAFAEQFSSTEAIEKAFGSPAKQTPQQKRAALLAAMPDEELQTEIARRYASRGFA